MHRILEEKYLENKFVNLNQELNNNHYKIYSYDKLENMNLVEW